MRLLPALTAIAAMVAACLPASAAALAPQAYDLRALSLDIDFSPGPPDSPATRYLDTFSNGAPLTGTAFTGAVSGQGHYSTMANGLPASAELSAPVNDFYGINYGLGALHLSSLDATPNPSNLDLPGTQAVSTRIRLDNPTSASLLNKNQSFEAATYWNYTIPDSGSFYGMRASDNPFLVATPGTPFNDLLDLRVIRGGSGQAQVNLRRLSSDGTLLTVPQAYFVNVASGLYGGHTLAEVALIGLEMHYNALGGDNPKVLRTAFFLMDGAGNQIGSFSFTQLPTLFNGEDGTTLAAGANWTQAVPEPGSWALMLGGMLALGARRLRRGPR